MEGDRIVSESLRWYGEWAENEINILRRFIGEGSVVMDIGAFIGTHTIAFGRAVGFTGRVHAFEPRPEVHAVLARNVARNGLNMVVLHQAGVSDAPGELVVSAFDPGSVSNPGGLSLEKASVGVTASIITVDSLGLDKIDLMKIDVEGMEAHVLRGAQVSIATLRPAIFAECNTMEGAKDVLASFEHAGYSTFGVSYPAYNADNFRRNAGNIFGINRECALLFIPDERLPFIDLGDMTAITSLDDVVGLLMNKPQYVPEVLPHLNASRPHASNGTYSEQEQAESSVLAQPEKRPLNVIVLLSGNDSAMDRLSISLQECRTEFEEAGARIYLCDGSPSHQHSERLRARLGSAWPEDFLQCIDSPQDAGFAGACNRAFEMSVASGADVMLLAPEIRLFPGAISEIAAVAALDPMFGFAAPRIGDAGYSAERAYASFIAIAPRLARYTLVPSLAGNAVWIKGNLLAELGGFSGDYMSASDEINDLVMRANRCGYRAVVANRAFAGGEAQASAEDALNERYPERASLMARHIQSPTQRAEKLLGELHQPDLGRLIAFDLSNFGAFHNGTFESGIRLLKAAARCWPAHVRLAALMSAEAWQFHGLDGFARLVRIDPESETSFAAVVRIGQPFHIADLRRMFLRAPVVAAFMLDTISADCGYLSLKFDPYVWAFALGESDLIFTNSEFTLERIRTRYRIGAAVETCVSRHSLDPAEYAPAADASGGTASHIFVVGNQYAHKFVQPTVNAIVNAYPERHILAVGYPDTPLPPPSVEAHAAGSVDNARFERFYADASVVVLPSHYEGFGFPILHALARRKPIFVRDSMLARELIERISASANIHLYDTTASLVDRLASPPAWTDETQAVRMHRWENSAIEVWQALERAMTRASASRIQARLERLPEARGAITPGQTDGHRISAKLAPLFDRLLKVPGVRAAVHRTRRLARRLSASVQRVS
jgi:FkbM family methyltransferase